MLKLKIFTTILSLMIGVQVLANTLPKAKFLQQNEASEILKMKDTFINSLNAVNMQLRLNHAKIANIDFIEFLSSQSLSWEADEVNSIQNDFNQLLNALKILNLQINYPPEVFFIKTTGLEEFEAPHTRQNAIILPHGKSSFALIVHEFFHILSRYNPQIKNDLYSISGFKPLSAIQKKLPQEIINKIIVNPDAPFSEYFTTVSINNQDKQIVPLVLSNYSPEELPPNSALHEILSFKLFDINTGTQFDFSESDYVQKTRANTGYFIHPEEILAENFVYLIYQTLELPIKNNPKYPEAIIELKNILQLSNP